MAEKKTEEYYSRPPTMSRGQQFSKFLYNGETHEVLGRTAKSWCKFNQIITSFSLKKKIKDLVDYY